MAIRLLTKLLDRRLSHCLWTVLGFSFLLIVIVVAAKDEGEPDFEFTDSDIRLKRSLIETVLDDEDILNDESGDGNEGSGIITETTETKPAVRGYPAYYRVTLKFPKLNYTSGLSNRYSPEFTQLARRLETVLQSLFVRVPGEQRVSIISFRRGSVEATFDLGSDGFADEETIRRIIEEAIESGFLGPYEVTAEDFSFRQLGEAVACPKYVGREPSQLTGSGNNHARLLINNVFQCQGNIIGWEYYRISRNGDAYVGIWRQTSDNEFLLVDKTLLPPANIGKTSVFLPEPIAVNPGDFIGIFYDRFTPSNVIGSATSADNLVSANELYQLYDVEVFNDMVQTGRQLDIDRVQTSLLNGTFALRAVMSYPEDGSGVASCKPTEYQCDNGDCIKASYRCDRQMDCSDNSDETRCEPTDICGDEQFKCRSGECIDIFSICNGRIDCRDGSDEDDCPEVATTCSSEDFECGDGKCISYSEVCNGFPNCDDNSDELSCLPPVPEECPQGFFGCDDGSCINSTLRCNGYRDCPDGSDETTVECGVQCRFDEFTCADSTCIDRRRKCDRYRDCPDGSDEVNCECRRDEHKCRSNGQCIPRSALCNNRQDCPDGSDESDCAPRTCPPGQYTCDSGQCIYDSHRCNGRRECRDGSDERDCERPVIVTVSPKNIRVREGRDVVLSCDASGSTRPAVRWERVGRGLPARATEINGRLTIQGVRVEDAGDYVCSTVGLRETYQDTARVTVDFIGPTESPLPSGPCGRDESACSDGKCIPRDYICDGENDCDDGSDEQCAQPLECEPNEFRCSNGRCAMKIWRCDGDNDCGDGSDEVNCPTRRPGAPCNADEYHCLRGDQCIPSSYQCDGEIDCQDRSDEIGCSSPSIRVKPQPNVEVEIGGEFSIFCEAVGVPTPLIVWRLNWGHIPSGQRVTTTSIDGRGSLTITNVVPEDSGAYTCEAINNKGSIFAVPDAIIIVRRQSGICRPPSFNADAKSETDCIRCFCFGQTQQCFSSNLQNSQITLGNRLELIRKSDLRPVEEGYVQFIPSTYEFLVEDFNRVLRGDSYYWKLPQQYLGNRVSSYGGYLSYKTFYEIFGFNPNPTSDPDVIISGNGITLYHRLPETPKHNTQLSVDVPLTEAAWDRSDAPRRGDTPISEYASREDLMMVLENVTSIWVRATYDNSQSSVRISNVLMTTAVTQDQGMGRAVLVEECTCPTGYTGSSCEICAAGFYRVNRGRYLGECVPCNCNGHSNDCDPVTGVCRACRDHTTGPYCDQCEEGYAGNPRRGTPDDCEACPCPLSIPSNQFSRTCVLANDGLITCTNCPDGYEGRQCERCAEGYIGNPREVGGKCSPIDVNDFCDERGTNKAFSSVQSCNCKANVVGQNCDTCRRQTFYLSSDNPYGCLSCFCSGVTESCTSTSQNRAQVGVSFNSDRMGVNLTDMMQKININEGFTISSSSRELVYRRFDEQPNEVLYWSLPSRFLGNKISAYGGFLRFTLRYRPGLDSSPIGMQMPMVEISGNDIVFMYRRNQQIPANSQSSFQIPLTEQNWMRLDGKNATREFFLMTLADLDAIMIRATYTESTAEAALSDVTLDIAEDRFTGQDRAWAVEQCICPQAYKGLSCEDCNSGYTRTGGGLYLGLCTRCNCNGHSNDCDPETGVCRNCQHNTAGDNCERCLPGFYGDATRGTINDCQKCPCPLTTYPNQFSPTCIQDTDGQVTCLACPTGHTGRRCEICEPGFVGNPLQPGDSCKKFTVDCDCDPRGTIPNTQCDPNTRQCPCRTNAQGLRCSTCKDGYFYLDQGNQDGCLPCFCMGITNKCSSSSYYRDVITPTFPSDGSHNFGLTNRRMSRMIKDGFTVDASRNQITYNRFDGIQRERESLFFQVPPRFRGNMVSAYGGKLKFTLEYTAAEDTGQKYMDVDFEIMSNNQRIYLLFNPSARTGQPNNYEILMREETFRLLDGSTPSREAFLSILANIDGMLIRATHHTVMNSVTLRDLSMEYAVPGPNGRRRAPEVESCQCPDGYTGLSCEECAVGYLRVPDAGTALGRCVRCNCNGHSSSCDPESGRCLNCRDNTEGDRCERCIAGYYGDPTVGTANDCRQCACPLTLQSNQFSPTCFLDTDNQVTCDRCRMGYTGRNCGECAPGYVGNPREPGGTCQREEVDYRPRVTVSPIQVSEPVGSTVTFQCQVQGRGPFNVVWSRSDGRPLSDNARSQRYELTLNDIQYTDEARYVCSASNQYGTTRANVQLTVTRPVQTLRIVIESPTEVDVDAGSRVRFVCRAVSYSSEANYILSWTRNGAGLPPKAVDENGVLSIYNVQPEDAGTYTCTGSDPFSVDRATAVVNVRGVDESPVVRIEPRYAQVEYGQPVELLCSATGNPEPVIEWFRGQNGPLQSSVSVVNGMFKIEAATKSDESEYYCKATNSAGMAQVRTIVYVTGQPAVLPEVQIIIRQATVVGTVGSSVQMECYSQDGNVKLTWSRQGGLPSGTQDQNGVLTIPNLQPSYAGIYICTGTTPSGRTGSGRATLEVRPAIDREAPTATIEPDMQTIGTGLTGTLRCATTGKPKPTVTWSRSRGELSDNHVINGDTLRITQASMADRGIYVCMVESVAGRAQASAIIDVERRELPSVEIYPQGSQTIARGGSALFQCRVSGGSPSPTVVWSRVDNEPFTATTEVMNGNGVIMFKQVTGEEQGQYVCTATNVVGVVTSVASLRIEGPPKVTIKPGRKVTAIVGETVTLECTGEGAPTPNIFWRSETPRRSDILPETYAPKDGSALLIFDDVQKQDAGRYICIATNEKGKTEDTVDLSVNDVRGGGEGFVNIAGPERLSVREGQSVELTCSAEGFRNTIIKWRRPGSAPLPPGHSVRAGTLYIPRVTPEYDGEYVCVVQTDRGDYTDSVFIIVSVLANPVVTPSNIKLKAGDELFLRCRAQGPGPYTFEWQKVNGILSPSAVDRDGILKIRQVTAADAGRYRCIVTSSAGTSEGYSDVSLSVQPTINIGNRERTSQVGQTLELRCSATGSPPPQITWSRDNGELPPQHRILNGVLTIYNLQEADAGRYICTASNDGGSVRDYLYLRVSAGPDIGTPLNKGVQTVDVGDRVEFECIVTGSPPPTVTWSKLGGNLPLTAEIGDGVLVIPAVQPEDAGGYTCTATNQAGSVKSQVQLLVRAKPVILPSRDIQTAALGSSATLSCETRGFPQPVVTWSKQNGDLPSEHRIIDNNLEIERVRDEDKGTYYCDAANRYGSARIPIRLIVGALVPYFGQNPNSYMSYAPMQKAYLDFDVILSFRPESTDGLLLYNGQYADGNGDYMCFGLNGAYPEFKFDVGAGPAVIRGQQPLEMNKWHTVQLKRDRKNGTLIVNDQPAYSSIAPGQMQGLDLIENMYLGGVPNYRLLSPTSGYSSGFVGAVSQVQLQGLPLNLGGDAVEIYGIEQYNACQDRPCVNRGSCQPANNVNGYICLCPQGYSGSRCEQSGQSCYPGACGEGRCVDLSIGSFQCVCPMGQTGLGCRQAVTIFDPSFNRTSFITYPTIRNGLLQMNVKIMFKPQSLDDGIILYNAQNQDARGDFVAIVLKDGYLEFRFDTGSGPAILRSRNQLELGEWTTVAAERSGRDGMLVVNNEMPVNERQDINDGYFYSRRDRGDIYKRVSASGNTIGLNLKRPLYLGGIDPQDSISSGVGTNIGFVGCVAELKINNEDVDLIKDAIESSYVQDCGDRSLCERRPCLNGGACRNEGDSAYKCICPAQYTGVNCETEINICITSQPCRNGGICRITPSGFKCDCPLGYMGLNCETEVRLGTSVEFAGDGYAEFSKSLLPHRKRQAGEYISFSITTLEPDGLIFWQGQEAGSKLKGADYVAISLSDGFVDYRYELGGGPRLLRSRSPINDGNRHRISVERHGRAGNLTVDNEAAVLGESPGRLQVLNAQGNIYLGGVPNLEMMTDGAYLANFNGCIEDVKVLSKGPLDLSTDALRGYNVRPCLN